MSGDLFEDYLSLVRDGKVHDDNAREVTLRALLVENIVNCWEYPILEFGDIKPLTYEFEPCNLPYPSFIMGFNEGNVRNNVIVAKFGDGLNLHWLYKDANRKDILMYHAHQYIKKGAKLEKRHWRYAFGLVKQAMESVSIAVHSIPTTERKAMYGGSLAPQLIIKDMAFNPSKKGSIHAVGSGIKKREHLVRGFVRNYKSGKTCFVKSHKRGDSSLGRLCVETIHAGGILKH